MFFSTHLPSSRFRGFATLIRLFPILPILWTSFLRPGAALPTISSGLEGELQTTNAFAEIDDVVQHQIDLGNCLAQWFWLGIRSVVSSPMATGASSLKLRP